MERNIQRESSQVRGINPPSYRVFGLGIYLAKYATLSAGYCTGKRTMLRPLGAEPQLLVSPFLSFLQSEVSKLSSYFHLV